MSRKSAMSTNRKGLTTKAQDAQKANRPKRARAAIQNASARPHNDGKRLDGSPNYKFEANLRTGPVLTSNERNRAKRERKALRG